MDEESPSRPLESEKESEENVSIPPAPLYPKSGEEWGMFALDLAVIGMVPAAFGGQCPSIPSVQAFAVSFVAVTIITSIVKFHYGLRRPGQDKLYPMANGVAQALGIAQLGIGIWGIVLIAPNLDLFSDIGPTTCEMAPLIALTIPSGIIALVIVGLLFYAVYSGVIAKQRK